MSFNYSEITYDDALKLGSDDAPVKVIEYVNLRCPFSKKYEENVAPVLDEYIKDGKVQRILKHFDKEKYPLEVGSVLNQYLDYDTPEETYVLVQKIFANQDDWGNERLSHIPHVAKEYGLTLQENNKEQAERVFKEVQAVNVELIPTIFVGEKEWIGTVDVDEFIATIEKNI